MKNLIDRNRLLALYKMEREAFVSRAPKSVALSQRASRHLLFGVPLHWMNDWPTPSTLYVDRAEGSYLTDVDGHQYIDFCLGDTGAMFGHAPEAVVDAIRQKAFHGFTTMLPTEDSVWVAEELSRRFALPYWQFATTASDANRFVLRWARAATGRSKILVFNGCYHGTVDDVFVDLVNGKRKQRDSLLGQAYEMSQTEVIEFNDLDALDDVLSKKDIACVLAEPVMTNIGMVLPQPGYWEAAKKIISAHGTLLAIDETHTISTGIGGYSGQHKIEPDIFILGKPIAGGLPAAVYGFSDDVAKHVQQAKHNAPPGHSGIGTTLSANMLTMSVMRATLTGVMTESAYTHMTTHAQQLSIALEKIINQYQLPWCVTQVGARTEFQFSPTPPKNGSEAGGILNLEIEQLIHLSLLNRGIIITPFHNMILVSPKTTKHDIDTFTKEFSQIVEKIVS